MSSMHEFFDAHPADFTLRDQFLATNGEFGAIQQPPYVRFANELAIAGSAGLKMVEVALSDTGLTTTDRQYGDALVIHAKPEMSAIVWGTLLPEIPRSINRGFFDMARYIARMNELLGDTIATRFPQPQQPMEALPKQLRQEMIFVQNTDPTYSLFHKEPWHLPRQVRKLFTENGYFTSPDMDYIVKECEQRIPILLGVPTEELEGQIYNDINDILGSFDL